MRLKDRDAYCDQGHSASHLPSLRIDQRFPKPWQDSAILSGQLGRARTAGQSRRAGGSAEQFVAVARPATSDVIPLLYVFDEESNYDHAGRLRDRGVSHPIFDEMDSEVYWGELVDDHFYHVPSLDKCSQASMLDTPLDFHAPASDIMFVQFIASGCRQCETISKEIESIAKSNPELPFRWVQVLVPRKIGKMIAK